MPQAVLDDYLRALETIGNPASTHSHGQLANELLETAREQVASHLGCEPVEVVFTSGGTESINLAIKGTFWERQKEKSTPIILAPEGEHHATLEAIEWLEQYQDAEPVWLPINDIGVLEPETLREAIETIGPSRVALVSLLWANNEVGSIQPVEELANIAKAASIPVHIDGVSALGQIPVNFRSLGASMLSLSAHKIGGPPGVGALILSRNHEVTPLMHGGSQQRGRSGTQNVAGAVGFASALAQLAPLDERIGALESKRDRLIATIRDSIPGSQLRGADPLTGQQRLPGNVHFTFTGCQGDSLLFLLDTEGISVSVGSACQAGVQEVSHVLLAMGIDEQTAMGSLRMTLAAETDEEEITALLRELPSAVERARKAGLS